MMTEVVWVVSGVNWYIAAVVSKDRSVVIFRIK
jgi:hypothetical protein